MGNLKDKMDLLKKLLREKNVSEALCSVGETTNQALIYENGECYLLNTSFKTDMGITVIENGKTGTSLTSDTSEEGMRTTIDNALTTAESSNYDEANAIAGPQESLSQSNGPLTPDMALLVNRVIELAEDIKKDYPKVLLMQITATHSYTHRLTYNTNGGDGDFEGGLYEVALNFAGNDGEKTAGITGADVLFSSLEKPLIELDSIRETLKSAEDELSVIKMEDKFVGPVIFTPGCVNQIFSFTIGSLASGGVLLEKTGPWLDKCGKQVASKELTIKFAPHDKRILGASPLTTDGFWSENYTIIEEGIFKQFDCNLYVSKKCNVPHAPNERDGMIVESGTTPLADMIKDIKKGLLVGAISAGFPSSSGELSGVAKNSFYIEDGQIIGAVNETMISTNLADLMMHVHSLSKECWNCGYASLPYICFDGVNIAGK